MDEIQKCAQVLRPVVASGDLNGILLAERAIDEMVSRTPPPRRRSSLESVRLIVNEHGRAGAPGSQGEIAKTIDAYIEKLMRGSE